MLQAGTHSPALYAVNIFPSHHTGKIGIFRKIFKISAIQRRSFYIDTGREQHIRSVFDTLIRNRFAL